MIKVNQFEHHLGSTANSLYPGLGDIYNFLNEKHNAWPMETALFEIGKTKKNNLAIPLIRLGYLPENRAKSFLIVAGTHGDEAAPVVSINYLIEQVLKPKQLLELYNNKIAIDIIPVHNPEGYLENQRENDNGIDINRNFPFGNVKVKKEQETDALVSLINTQNYTASLFFHSANESKYENLVRVPVEYNKTGIKALQTDYEEAVLHLSNVVMEGGNIIAPEIPWHSSSEMVDVTGIASDWCMSGALKKEYNSLIKDKCKHSHPSLTIELCYPKQPLEEARVESEKEELKNIVLNVISKF